MIQILLFLVQKRFILFGGGLDGSLKHSFLLDQILMLFYELIILFLVLIMGLQINPIMPSYLLQLAHFHL